MVPLKLTLNGRIQEFPTLEAGVTLAVALDTLGLKPDRIAVEQNGEIVPRSQWPSTHLSPGDRLEVVHFVGGGTSEPLKARSR